MPVRVPTIRVKGINARQRQAMKAKDSCATSTIRLILAALKDRDIAVRTQGSGEKLSDEQILERTPEDIPITVDDDIIARQLREAALAEEDPELRERLWEEYRKYKGI